MLFCYDRETGQSASFSCRLTVASLITAIQRGLHTMLRGTARKHSWRISVFTQSQANAKVARGQNTNEDLEHIFKNMMFIHQIQTPIKNTGPEGGCNVWALYSLLMGQTPRLFGFNLHAGLIHNPKVLTCTTGLTKSDRQTYKHLFVAAPVAAGILRTTL